MTIETDVVVVGGGLSGYVSAITAAESGAEATIVEKMSQPGGSTIHSGGLIVFAGTDMQVKAGIDDSSQVLRRDLIDVGRGLSDPELVDAYADEQLETFEWMREVGVEFETVITGGDQSRPRSHIVDVNQMFAALQRKASTLPAISYRFDDAAERLLRGQERVLGAHTRSGDVTGRYATILTTGGFSHSTRTFASFAPRLMGATPMGGEGATGDGLYMAMDLGADLADMGSLGGTFGVSADRSLSPLLMNAMYHGAIVVNVHGRRFADESQSYKITAEQCLEQPDVLGYQVFDERVMATSTPGKPLNDFRSAGRLGYLVKADSVGELAELLGIDAEALSRTVADYNRGIAGGTDEMGRTSIVSGAGELSTIDTPPYYAFPTTVGIPATYGGIRVDRHMRVLDVFGAPLVGLYAAGEIVGGFHGGGYISGTSLGKSAIFARIAGREASAH